MSCLTTRGVYDPEHEIELPQAAGEYHRYEKLLTWGKRKLIIKRKALKSYGRWPVFISLFCFICLHINYWNISNMRCISLPTNAPLEQGEVFLKIDFRRYNNSINNSTTSVPQFSHQQPWFILVSVPWKNTHAFPYVNALAHCSSTYHAVLHDTKMLSRQSLRCSWRLPRILQKSGSLELARCNCAPKEYTKSNSNTKMMYIAWRGVGISVYLFAEAGLVLCSHCVVPREHIKNEIFMEKRQWMWIRGIFQPSLCYATYKYIVWWVMS